MRRALLLGSLLAGCATPWLDLPVLPATPGEVATVVLDELHLTVVSDWDGPALDLDHQRAVRVQDDAGRAFAVPSMSWVSSFDTPGALEVRVLHAGSVQAIAPTLRTRSLLGQDTLVTDAWVRQAEFLAPLGSIVQWRSSVHRKRFDLRGFEVGLDELIPVTVRRIVVSADAGWEVQGLVARGAAKEPIEPAVTTDGSSRLLTWERRDVPAMPIEPYSAGDEWTAARLELRLAAWPGQVRGLTAEDPFVTLSREGHALVKPAMSADEPLRTVAAKLAPPGAPPDVIARAAYDWVRDGIGYCAIEIGMGAWVPHAAGEVARLAYGDCKDKAGVLLAILEARGVPARPALVATWAQHLPLLTPALTGFDHMIVLVDLPTGRVVVDPTAETAGWGELPVGDEDAPLLPLDPAGAPLERGPSSKASANVIGHDLALKLERDGSARGEARVRARGLQAQRLRQALGSTDVERRRGLARWELGQSALEVRTFEVSSTKPDVVLKFAFEHPRAAQPTSRGLVVSADSLLGHASPVLPARVRRTPVSLGTRRVEEEAAIVMVPPRCTVAGLPAPVDVRGSGFQYRLAWTLPQGRLRFDRSWTVDTPVIPLAEAEALRSALDRVRAADESGVLLACDEVAP